MRTRTGRAAVFALLLALASVCSAEPQRWLPVDQDGWTIFTPSADTRLLYVSSSAGDDAAGVAYAAADAAVGADPFRPVGPVHAFKTIAAAQKLAREGFPDWVLLKRGDSWRENPGVRSGRSASEPSLIAAYGDGPRPVLLGVASACPGAGSATSRSSGWTSTAPSATPTRRITSPRAMAAAASGSHSARALRDTICWSRTARSA